MNNNTYRKIYSSILVQNCKACVLSSSQFAGLVCYQNSVPETAWLVILLGWWRLGWGWASVSLSQDTWGRWPYGCSTLRLGWAPLPVHIWPGLQVKPAIETKKIAEVVKINVKYCFNQRHVTFSSEAFMFFPKQGTMDSYNYFLCFRHIKSGMSMSNIIFYIFMTFLPWS